MKIHNIIVLGLISILAVVVTSSLHDTFPAVAFFSIPLCGIVTLACTNRMHAMTYMIFVSGIFSDTLQDTGFPTYLIIYALIGLFLFLLMRSRLAQHTILAAAISSGIATVILSLSLVIYMLLSLHDWPTATMIHAISNSARDIAVAFILHAIISIICVALLSYSRTAYRFRPYTT
jgi:hypothetical protein